MHDRTLDVAGGAQKDKQAGQLSLFDTFHSQAPLKQAERETPNVREWPESQRLTYEKELLGFYLTGHPLARHERLLKAYCTAPIDQLGTLRDGADVTLGGVIAKVKVTTTKKGNERMAIVLLEDFTGSVEALVFPRAYAACAKAVVAEAIVFIRGRISLREESPKLLANDVISLDEARRSFTKGITVKLFTAGLEQSTMEAVYRVLKQYPGTVPVTLVFTTPERQTYQLETGEGCRVAPSDELFADLEALLGQDVVTVQAAPPERQDPRRSIQYAG
jgi:DNA polymerase-3 subunit alpha